MSKELKKQMYSFEEITKPVRKDGSSQRMGGVISGKLSNGKRIVIKTKNIEPVQNKPNS